MKYDDHGWTDPLSAREKVKLFNEDPTQLWTTVPEFAAFNFLTMVEIDAEIASGALVVRDSPDGSGRKLVRADDAMRWLMHPTSAASRRTRDRVDREAFGKLRRRGRYDA